MKKLPNIILLFALCIFIGSCNKTQTPVTNENWVSINAQPTTPVISNSKPNIAANNNNRTNANSDEEVFECVRAEPEAIINKKVFPKTSFRLEKNKEFPHQNLGYETVEFENGDKLLIENIGCENFTLVFHFETGRFSGDMDDARFWYKTAAELIGKTSKGIIEIYSVKRDVKALNAHIKKTKQLKFEEEIDYGGDVIRDVIWLEKVKKLENGKVKIVLSFGTGPL